MSEPRIEIVRQTYTNPMDAKEILMECEACGKAAFGPREHMQAAMEEHKRISCTAGGANEKRVYRLWYPRT